MTVLFILLLAASQLTPSAQAMRDVQCDQERAKAIKDGWDMSSIHLACEPGVVLPTRTRNVSPKYTAKAMKAKIQGVVVMRAVIETDGSIRDARVQESLDRLFGLDDEALKAVRGMKFTPPKQNGAPVRILVDIDMQFTLR